MNGARIQALDVLRSVALFIILAGGNLEMMQKAEHVTSAFGHVGYLSFALLFGAGFWMLLTRLSSAAFLWRLSLLFAVGVFHNFVIWSGDILAVYAFCAVPLLGLRRFAWREWFLLGVAFLGFSHLLGPGGALVEIMALFMVGGAVAGSGILERLPTLGFVGFLLAPAGRMALTNYLFASVFFCLLFGLGVGLELSRAELFGFAFVFWGWQVFLSVWWLVHFEYGPVEWLWRSAALGRWLPFTRQTISQEVSA